MPPSRRNKTRHVVVTGSCLDVLNRVNLRVPQWADMVFADPPFNQGMKYRAYKDTLARRTYLDWTRAWMEAVVGALKPDGTLWAAISDEYVHRFRMILEDSLGMHFRSNVIWHFTFGQCNQYGFTRSHTNLLYYAKDRKRRTWNGDAVKVPSWRLLNGDKRAAPGGKHPDDVWLIPRVCGTWGERCGWHPCQMPEKVLAQIIRSTSNPGDTIVDPFVGSGTTAVVAKKLGRSSVGTEVDHVYASRAKERIAKTKEGDPILGERDGVPAVEAPGRGRRDPADRAAPRPTVVSFRSRRRVAGKQRITDR